MAKLLQQNVNGKMLKITTACIIVLSHVLDKIIKCRIIFIAILGVRQGGEFITYSFSLLLNDLIEFISHGLMAYLI